MPRSLPFPDKNLSDREKFMVWLVNNPGERLVITRGYHYDDVLATRHWFHRRGFVCTMNKTAPFPFFVELVVYWPHQPIIREDVTISE